MTTIEKAIAKRSHESKYKSDSKNEAKGLGATQQLLLLKSPILIPQYCITEQFDNVFFFQSEKPL